jgi:hypothetical protein
VKSVMAAGWTAGPDGTWLSSTFALSEDSLGFHHEGLHGVWRWIELSRISSLDQTGADDEGRLELEFVLFDGRTLTARLPESFVDKIVDGLLQTREQREDTGDEAMAPPEPEPAAPAPASASASASAPAPPEPAPPLAAVLPPRPAPAGRPRSKSALEREVRELREYIDHLEAALARARGEVP